MKIGLAGLAFAIALTVCPAAIPSVSCVAEVLADALKGDTIAQILADCGPTRVTDAEQVITILLGSTDARVQATPAYAEAVMLRRGGK